LIDRRTVVCLGLSQLICWGISYYLIGGFGAAIGDELGWSKDLVYGGLSEALLVMGLLSAPIGRMIERHGGRPMMSAGSLVTAVGCVVLALSHDVVSYYVAWAVLGVAMRLTLYDAAFASLARIGGAAAKRPIAQITLLGGLASTVFWPIGNALAEQLGWRGAVLVYAAIAIATLPLHLAIPRGRYGDAGQPAGEAAPPPRTKDRQDRIVAAALYLVIATIANFLNSAMSAHMIGILGGLGLGAAVAVWISTLRGIGQSLARLADVLFGRNLSPMRLNLVACSVLPACFVAGLYSNEAAFAAIFFAFVYGAGNGIVTITRGTLPLVLFDPRSYGSLVGRLLVPSFLLSAGAPLAYAAIIDRFGYAAALHVSTGLACAMLLAAIVLAVRYR